MVDMAHRIEPDARFFYVDTELLFPETYETRDALAERYGIEFERIANGSQPLVPRRPDGCCADRKVELMHTALDDVELLGLGHPPGRLGDPRRRSEVRLGRAVRALEAEPAGRLG